MCRQPRTPQTWRQEALALNSSWIAAAGSPVLAGCHDRRQCGLQLNEHWSRLPVHLSLLNAYRDHDSDACPSHQSFKL
ncbi:hypothetical protein TKK_0015278 [Trichogramma kaykai]